MRAEDVAQDDMGSGRENMRECERASERDTDCLANFLFRQNGKAQRSHLIFDFGSTGVLPRWMTTQAESF